MQGFISGLIIIIFNAYTTLFCLLWLCCKFTNQCESSSFILLSQDFSAIRCSLRFIWIWENFFCFYKIMSSEFISDFTNLSSPSFYFLTICVTKSSSNLLIFSKSHLLVVLIFFCFSLFCVTYLCSALLFFYWLCM